MTKSKFVLLPLFLVLVSYLLINTGIFSDDFVILSKLKDKSLLETIMPQGRHTYFIETPFEHYTHYIWYHFFNVANEGILNLLKILYIFLSFYFTSLFFKIFMDDYYAYLGSFLFIFYPSHDSTVYFFMLQYLTLSFGLYLYSYYLAHNNKYIAAFLLALVSSFLSYGSTPIALALFILFILHKELKKGLVLFIPNIIYICYYFLITRIFGLGVYKFDKNLDICSLTKRLILQIGTFIDAVIGPSMWIKIYYSFSQISVFSIVIGSILTAVFYKTYRKPDKRYNVRLITCLSALTVISWILFASTGLYPQLAFGFGNRVTIFGSILITYLIILIPASRILKTLIFALFIFCILGTSDHWKAWNIRQQGVLQKIADNPDLKNYMETKTIYVSGNQRSKYGAISNIEFLSEDWVVSSIFNLLLDNKIEAFPINKRHRFVDGHLVDTKYKTKRKVDGYINIYDSERDLLFRLYASKISSYIESMPEENRHWIFIARNPYIKKISLQLMPRLEYLF